MRYTRYILLGGLFWWGCNASPDSLSDEPNFLSSESEQLDERRGCGEEEDDDYVDGVYLDIDDEEVIDEGAFDTGEVYCDE